MESGRGPLRRVAAAAACSLALAACATDTPSAAEDLAIPTSVPTQAATVTPFEVPDLTSRTITTDALLAMLPADASATTVRTNELLVLESTLDRDDQSRDIVAAGRVGGVGAEYERETGTAFVWIDVLETSDAAHAYLVDLAGDIAKGVDGTHTPSTALSDPAEFAVTSGEEAVGLVGTSVDGSTETLVIGRLGRIVYFASEVRPTSDDARVAVQYLVDDTTAGILETLGSEPIDLAATAPADYRFQTTIEVSTQNDRWTTESIGTVAAGDVSCTLERATPTGALDLSVVAIDDQVWAKAPGDGGFRSAGADVVAGSALGWCPTWPLSGSAAGLTMGTEGPRHNVNGVDATGHQGDAVLLAGLGVTDPLLAVDTFSYWVADGTDWVVELSLLATAPADTLVPLIGMEFAGIGTVTVSIRHRVFDLGAVDPLVAPN